MPSAVIKMPTKNKNKDNGDKVKSSKKNAGQPKVTSKRLAKEYCQVCKKKADKAEDGIVCGVCGYFYHASCKDLGEEIVTSVRFCLNNPDVMVSPWRCDTCMTALASMYSNIERNTRDIAILNNRMDANEQAVSSNTDKVEKLEKRLEVMEKKQEDSAKHTCKETTKMVYSELKERESRRLNVVIHGLPPVETDDEAKASVVNILEYLQLEARPAWCRRLAVGNKNRPSQGSKPILARFDSLTERDSVLKASPALGKSTDKDKKLIKISPDLTAGQREAEDEIRKECKIKNNSLTLDDKNKRLAWKVVGPKGAVRIQKIEMREYEVLHNGRVIPKDAVKISSQVNNEEVVVEEEVPATPTQNRTKKGSGSVKEKAQMYENIGSQPGTSGQVTDKRKFGSSPSSQPSGSPPLKTNKMEEDDISESDEEI